MSKKIDKNRPYAEVHGVIGAVYEQDGIYYTANGEQSLLASPFAEEPPPVKDNSPWSTHFLEEVESPPHDAIKGGDEIETMHWRHLKTLVESYGGTWTNRSDALRFLKEGK